MKYRRLGRTGMKVSVMGLGTWQFGGDWGKVFEQSEVDLILSTAQEHGINLIDTAECYGDHTSERLIGEAIKHNRDQWVVATKFGHRFHTPQHKDSLWRASDVLQQLDRSLKALQTDYIDLYQYHSGSDEQFDQDELREVLQRQVQAGKIRHIGNSLLRSDMTEQTELSGKSDVKVIQVVYNRLDQLAEDAVFPSCVQQNLGVMARVPLASGYLTGKYKPGTEFPENDVRSRHNKELVEHKLRAVQEITLHEIPEGMPMSQWALAWCLQHPAVTCVIPGSKDVAQLLSNIRSTEHEMVLVDHPQAWNV